MKLKNWTIKTEQGRENVIYYLKGNVYGHTKPTCPDGTYIHTSSIISAEDRGNMLAVNTKHSLYIVRKNDMDTTIYVDLVKEFCEKFLGGSYDLAEKAQFAHSEFLKNGELIKPGMLYLQLATGRENFFAGALYRDADGTVKDDYAAVHVGTFDDSVIMMNTGVRWFLTRNGVEFYQTLYSAVAHHEPVLGFIRNVGVTPLSVTFSFGGTATIMPGELYEVKAPKQKNTPHNEKDN